jgi:hypothetical protein
MHELRIGKSLNDVKSISRQKKKDLESKVNTLRPFYQRPGEECAYNTSL